MSISELRLELRRYGDQVDRHAHDHHQLVLPVSGVLEMDIAGQSGAVTHQALALIPAGTDHEFAADGENCFVIADIPAALAPELERLPRYVPLDPALSQYVSFLARELQEDQPSVSSQRQMLLLLVQLLKERFADSVKLDRRVEAARCFLEQNFGEDISLQRLSSIANLGPRQLSERFRRELGMTPHQYLCEIRMQRAWQLIHDENSSILQIAQQVGFNNLAAFSDRFRRHFGHSPRYFRQLTEK